jgi:SSS family solute:Na+ symporter
VLWGVFGLAAIVLYAGQVHHSDLVWGYATRDLLGSLGIGLVGLMIACLMAALMSTVDCLMLTCSSLLTHNLYAQVVPGRSQQHYVWAGRVAGALVVIGGAWIALQFDTILQILKFIWEVHASLIPAFWLGMKWRRAHRIGAWTSILFGTLFFLALPVLSPLVFPQMRTNPALLKTTDPAPLQRSYVAGEADVLLRESEIEAWDRLAAEDREMTARPEPLEIGDAFEVTYQLPRKSIFWTQGLQTNDEGDVVGKGAFNADLYLIDRVGVDLGACSYAFNETLRILVRLAVPMLIMIGVSVLLPREDTDTVKRFFLKMRTHVQEDSESDEKALAQAYADPKTSEQLLLFPRSNWELMRWNRQDFGGFVAAIAAVAGILLLMKLLVGWGG